MTSALRTILELGKPRRLALMLALTLVVALSEGLGFVLFVPLLTGLDGVPAPTVSLGLALPDLSLGQILAALVALAALRALAELGRNLAAQKLTAAVVDGLRMRAYSALLAAEWRILARMRQSDNRAMLTANIDRVGYSVTLLADLLRIALSLAALGLAALTISPWAALAGAAAGAFFLLLLAGLRRRARGLGELLNRKYDAIYRHLDETLGGLRLIKSFGRERLSREEAREAFSGMRDVEWRYLFDSGMARAALQIGAAIAIALLIWLAIERWDIAIAILLPLVALAIRAVPLLGQMQQTGQNWAHAAPALAEVLALARRAEAAGEVRPARPAPRLTKAITLDGVALRRREGRAALEDVSLVISAGSTTALVGPSGSGKSTLADLLGGLLEADGGSIRIDDTVLTGAARTAWRSRVAYVQQDPVLFTGSVRTNLLWGAPDASEAALEAALTRAAADFIHALPGGLDCELGESGRWLSGGERQRIALARALLREPDLLILDEATSALDDASERAIAGAVAALDGKLTVLIIGHRGLLAESARRRIVLDCGRVIAV